ncbi:MAG: NAD(P)-dependent oxidoreductase [Nitrosomonas sp.]|nr:MAG: NAD(P)-dependent oxidoreductase [Nitrosomonas sp.]
MPGLVAVTGATGFIGGALVNKLIQDGWAVRALTRTARFSASDSLRWINGNLDDQAALQDLVDGATHVIHCAATVRGNSYQEFAATNVEGTGNILRAIESCNRFPRFLLISSLAARQPELSWYAKSKFQSEQLLIDRTSTLAWTIFRPTAVYGPGDKELKPMFQAMYRGFFPAVGGMRNRFGLIHVHDFIAAIQTWLSSENTAHGIYELDDGTPGGYSYQSITALARQVWGRSVYCIVIPDFVIRSIAQANLWAARMLRYSAMLTPGKVNELQHHDWVCDNTPLIRVLPEWHPRIQLADALSDVIGV